LKFAVGVLTLFIVLTVIGLVYLARTRVPDLERTVIHPSIKSEVTVVRDDWGVPHIAAANETDAYFALGYCIAQDRLFQMEILRRVAHGELSELLGPLLIPIDKVIRSFRLRPEVEAAIERGECMSPEARQAVDAFMAGVNHRMETEPLPFEYAVLRIPARPFTAADCLCVAGLLSITFAEGLRTEPLVSMLEERHPGLDVDALFPGYTKETPVTIMESGQGDMPGFGFRVSGIGTAPCGTRDAKPETRNPEPALQDFLRATFDVSRLLGPALGSNSWVLGPSRTRFGKPILANDPHIAFTNPGIWYEAHLKFPGFDLYGYYMPPLPFAFLGQNRDRAWAVTMLENDDIDLYRETFKYGAASIGTPLPDGPAKVMYKGQWVDVRQETETIKVRFWPDQQYTVRITPHGPVVTDLFRKLQKYNGPEVSLSWVWQKVPLTYLDAVYKAGHATDCESFGKALALVTSPGINVSYADAQGNIAWWAAGRIVIRPEHVNYKGLLDGASGRDEILGYLPFEQNPCLINPAAGCIVTANNLPTVKPLGPIKQIEGYWQPSDRAARIKQLLDSQDKWSIDELKAVQFDDVLYSAPPFIAAVLEILKPEASGWTLLEQEALNTLETWDCRHDVESIGATVFEVLHDMLVRDTVGDELGPDLLPTYFSLADHWNFMKYAVKEDSLPFWDDVSTPDRKESRKDIVIKAFKDTVNALIRQMGRDIAKWRWGKLHTIEFKHPFGYLPLLGRIFNVGPFPASGAHETINHMLYRAGKLPYNVQAGPSTRRLIDFGQPDRQLDILPTGNAGNFMSPNYADQSEMFMAGQYHEIRLTEDQIRTHKRHEMHFLPVAEMIPLR
jgi:penicillin amidase